MGRVPRIAPRRVSEVRDGVDEDLGNVDDDRHRIASDHRGSSSPPARPVQSQPQAAQAA